MSALARALARITWWWMLSFVRRPGIKRLQDGSWIPALRPHSARLRKNLARQNRLARKIGLPLLIITYNLVLLSIIVTLTYRGITYLAEQGFFDARDAIREKIGTSP